MKTLARPLATLVMSLAAMPAAAHEGTPTTLIASVQRALASAPGTFSAPTLDEVWANVDVWSKQQRAQADARPAEGAAKFLPPHLRNTQNTLARYAEDELLLLPQRNVRHDDGASLRAGAFTIGRKSDVAFAGRDDSPESSLGVVIEFEGDVAFAGDLPDAGRRAATQARNLGELLHAVGLSQPTRITLVPLASRPDQQVAEIRRALSQRYAGVAIAVSPEWP